FRVEPLDGAAPMYAQDISLGGLYVTAKRVRFPGELVAMRFTLPGQSQAIRVTARVVSIDEAPTGCGLSMKFLKVSADATMAIHRYIDSRPVVAQDATLKARVQAWIDRINEDCSQLLAVSRA
ncbi:MAG: PilZ domain-containing protein, partial [Myxococcota bacterium]